MKPTICSIEPERLTILDSRGAIEVVSALLWAEARRVGLSPTVVNISSWINVADGGVDATVDATAALPSDSFLRSARNSFQVKSGTSFQPWQKSAVEQELFGSRPKDATGLGRSVRECLEANGAYILVCTGSDPVAERQSAAEGHLREAFTACGYPSPNVAVWGINKIRGVIESFFPALAMRLNDRSGEMLTHYQWSLEAEMQRRLTTDEKQQTVLESLRADLMDQTTRELHIRGEPGIGKTRLVFEALKEPSVAASVLYCTGPKVARHLIADLRAVGDQVTVILVVDECGLSDRAGIWNQVENAFPHVSLVTIYNDTQETGSSTAFFDAGPLSQDAVTNIIESYGVPRDDAARYAELCDGSPRVAHVVGENLKHNAPDILSSPATIDLWGRYVAGYDDRSSPQVRDRTVVLRFLALFKRFGYGPPITGEARAIAGLIETHDGTLKWARFQETVNELRRRKVLQGESTLYITPKALHIWLWSQAWEVYQFDPKDIANQLAATPALVGWFHEMFRYARESKAATKVAVALLSSGGPLGEAGFFDDGRSARFFLALTEAAPEAALAYLERTVATWDHDRRRRFSTGRREAVWALERIAVWEPLFGRAARVLVALAEAENESFSNNATGVFVGLFSNAGGKASPTEAPPQARLPILRELLASDETRRASLGLDACDHALDSLGGFRIIGAEFQGLRRPPKLWTPATWDEVYKSYSDIWKLVAEVRSNKTSELSRKAEQILIRRATIVLQFPRLAEEVLTTLEQLSVDADTAALARAAESLIHQGITILNPADVARLRSLRSRLVDQNFHSRMERYVSGMSPWDSLDETIEDRDQIGPTIAALAEEAVRHRELLIEELPSLLDDRAANRLQFGCDLARADTKRTLVETLFAAYRAHAKDTGALLLCGYFRYIHEQDPVEWEELLSSLEADERLARYVPEVTWRSGMSAEAARRVLRVVRAGRAPVESLGMFAYGGVVRGIPEEILTEWIDALLAAATRPAASRALSLAFFFYCMTPKVARLDRDLVQRILSADPFFEAQELGQMEDYEWAETANWLIELHPETAFPLVDKLLPKFGVRGTISGAFHSRVRGVLDSAAKLSPTDFWHRLVPHLEVGTEASFHLRQWLRDGALNLMSPNDVWSWCEENPAKRAWYLATFVPRPSISAAAREGRWWHDLLTRYGDREDVRRNLSANYGTEGWSGPGSVHFSKKRQDLVAAAQVEKNSNVERWLREEITHLEQRIEAEKIDEERTRD